MKLRWHRYARALLLALASGVVGVTAAVAQTQTQPRPAGFFLGADISALDAPGRRPLPAYQEDGRPGDEVSILKRHGWTAFRVRVFVAPVRNAPNNTLENAIPLAKSIKASGATLVLDLHFSDTWADPQHQEIPVAWRGMDIKALAKQWEKHAYASVKALRDAGAMPDIVQIGNEITPGTAWPLAQLRPPSSQLRPSGWQQKNPGQGQSPAQAQSAARSQPDDDPVQWGHLTVLLKAGIRGVNKAAGRRRPRIAIHIDKGGRWEATEWYFDHIEAAHVPYDIIAESFYPPWGHGTLDDLWNNMNQCAERYHKDFLVVETGYLSVKVANHSDMLWPVTPEGRLQYMVDLVNTVKKAPRGIGVMYWEPEWDLWNADGSPGPAVFTLDNLTALTKRPESHAPVAVEP
jgi:arabinogalactan endo-1,4-beta-galactosidase